MSISKYDYLLVVERLAKWYVEVNDLWDWVLDDGWQENDDTWHNAMSETLEYVQEAYKCLNERIKKWGYEKELP